MKITFFRCWLLLTLLWVVFALGWVITDGFVQEFDIYTAHLPLEALNPTTTKHLIMGLVVPPVGVYVLAIAFFGVKRPWD